MDWLGVLGALLVIEGLAPLLNPKGWRHMFERLLQLRDGQLRFMGLVAVGAGALLWWLR